MSKFKVGDRVRIIKGWYSGADETKTRHNEAVGKVGSITDAGEANGWWMVSNNYYYEPSALELVSESNHTFKVGDIVKVRKSVYCPFTVGGEWNKGGRLGVVVYTDDTELISCVVFTAQGDKDGTHTWVYDAEDLKLVTTVRGVVTLAYGEGIYKDGE